MCYRRAVGRWVFSSVAALVLVGCTSEGEYACSDASMCVVAGVAGQCQSTGFCSFPDTTCPTGQRYGEYARAGLAYDCVPADTAGTDAGSGTASSSSTGGSSMTTLGTNTDPSASGTTTAATTLTTVGESGPISGGGSSTTGMSGVTTNVSSETSSSESESASESGMIEAPPCADFNFEDAMQAGAMLPDITIFEDDFTQSCLPGTHPDVVFFWVAPAAGMYEFYADVDPSMGIDVIGALWDGCDGMELVCDDDGGDVIDSRIVVDATAGEEFLWVVNAYGTVEAGFEVSIGPV